MLSLSAESICLVNGKPNIIQPVVLAEQGVLHYNNMWCYLFYKLTGEDKDNKGIAAFSIVLSKNLTITALLDRVFPAIASTNNQPMQYVTTNTVAYIFALIIDCVTVFHQDSPHSRALQHETILKELNSMAPDDFRTELRGSLTDFYENILKKADAGGRPVAMPLSSKFVTKAASLPAPDPAAGADGEDNNVVVPRADSDAAAPPPGPAAAEPAAAPPALAAPTTPPRGRRAGRGGGKPKTS
jgi:hypothetical protein